jgi:parvulin-like peptidyl-prolyl isomerase
VNGVALSDRDLLREMMQIFPYARTHNGFPKDLEGNIRKGALQMIEFEELVYQEAQRRKMTVSPERVNAAVRAYKSRFQSEEEFHEYLKTEMNGSMEEFRKTAQRSLLIETFLKSQLDLPSRVTLLQAKEYYQKNPAPFAHPEMIQFQSISIMPSEKSSAEAKTQAHKKAEDAWGKAKATKNFQEFGLLAEKMSEDDFRVNMGNHKSTARTALPPEVLKVLDPLKPGQVSGICQFGPYYTILRLEARTPAGKTPFEQVRAKLQEDLHKDRYNSLRGSLDQKLRASAKIEEL